MTGQYVSANGVNTYYEEQGAGEPVLLLHGGFGSGEDSFATMAPALATQYRVIVPDRRGHGKTADVEGPISYDLMAKDTIAFMDAVGIAAAPIVGYSDGGNVGMIMA